ncbi:MAG: aminomethyl-transferring glycine dehydrogenase subunit GcvPA [Alphaproteobacteria bacterium]|nr:aminomethyl-transferring glycine dehydrogenase subunit GcvPA [Alphaproteobacteria bacterium]
MRYLPQTEADQRVMLAKVGAKSVEALFKDVPEAARLKTPLDLPDHQGEIEVERHLRALAAVNVSAGDAPFFVGAGAYRHHVPASVDALIQRGEFLTSYTPYQPEIAQGTLQVLFEFQTQVALLTGMEVANASMYDGPTGCAEAVLMARRVTGRKRAILSGGLHPHYRDATVTVTRFLDMEIDARAPDPSAREDLAAKIDSDTACVVVQNPSVFGQLRDLTALADACHAKGALLIAVVTEVVSLGAVTPPGAMGADIVVAEGQGLGNALNFGGPYLGLFAAREKFLRTMPGRLCGETVDADGRRGYVLTLSTREQHIRREKATSNICTNSGLCALAFTIHVALLGEEGMTRLARINHERAGALAKRLERVKGVKLVNDSFFNEITVTLTKPATAVVSALAKLPILAGVPASRLFPERAELANHLILAATELTTDADIEALAVALEKELAA